MKEQQIEWIPIAQIHTEIPLSPGRQEFSLIVGNIREAGLKKPITVLRRGEPDEDGKQFDLVCGYYRIQAFIALGQTTIPAIILEASPVEIAQDACEGSADERTTR
jgi:ParB family chromosome partitioning protein